MNNRRKKRIKALAYFHRYGLIAIMFLGVFIFPKAGVCIMGVGFIIYAIWSFVGYKCKWKHIYCSYQDASHLKMTPEHINWAWIKKSDAYGVPIIFFLIGTATLCIYIINLIVVGMP